MFDCRDLSHNKLRVLPDKLFGNLVELRDLYVLARLVVAVPPSPLLSPR